MKVLIKILVSFFVFLSIAACATFQSDKSSVSTNTLENIQAFLPGDYVGMSSRGEVYHSIIELDVPAFGGEVFYHHISTESLRGPAMQRKIYRFEDAGQTMRSTVVLGEGEAIADLQALPRQLNSLSEEQLLRFPDGCRFQWRSEVDGFVAEVKRDVCSYDSPAFGGLVSPEMQYRLSACGLAINEGIYRQDGSPVFPPSITDNKRTSASFEDC